ncbi:putative ATP-dependent RNA helicase DHX57 [Lineus longissimus]|uniref:putative ATP-dependent RNA helicase DHX57 n=1 Tax=Lineus longissimus TaxID=88925 RepID=UPI002B4C3D41
MSSQSVKRKGGKPNRGGGRFNKPSGGRGGAGGRGKGGGPGFSRKGTAAVYDDGGPLVVPSQNNDSPERSFAHHSSSFTRSKVNMQKLYMSNENQDMVRDVLSQLHRNETTGDGEYSELDQRYTNQYWMNEPKLIIESVHVNDFEAARDGVEEKRPEELYGYGLKKLQRYGFAKTRCVDALEQSDGDIGAALEFLLTKMAEKYMQTSCEAETTPEEIQEQRQEEMMALESIYGDDFKEKIADKIWTLKMELPALNEVIESRDAAAKKKALERLPVDNREVCRFFLRGNCKFGHRNCRYKHVIEKEKVPQAVLTESDMETMYEVEVRFPQDNKYPFQCPLVAFYSTNDKLPSYVCLNLSCRLMQEAQNYAQDGLPAVFSLVTLLENPDELEEIFSLPRHPFSSPAPVITNQTAAKRDRVDRVRASIDALDVDDVTVDQDEESSDSESEAEAGKSPSRGVKTRPSGPPRLSPGEILKEDKHLKSHFQRKKTHRNYLKMQETRQKLPAWKKQEEILWLLRNNQVTVVSGMTGCGKTTQVPQFILDSYLTSSNPNLCNIICTQPRRISAMAVGERVSEERSEKLGGIVGYQIRLESRMSKSTRLLFCTTGILLRRLESDTNLDGVTHIIVDEVHERSEDSDFLIMVLRDLLMRRNDLKLILMSATLNADLFSNYFNGCPVIDIPGKTFPVDRYFLEDVIENTGFVMEEHSPYARPVKFSNTRKFEEDINEELESLALVPRNSQVRDNIQDQNLRIQDLFVRYSDYRKSTVKVLATMDFEKINYDLVELLLEWIAEGDHEYPRGGAVLVFLPGYAEITTMFEQLMSNRLFGKKQRFSVIPLHSSLSSEEQHIVFNRPREGVTKIVLATNIAETSITIDDIIYVIDCGKMKEKRFDPSKSMESLETVWVSRANAIQREGRAGRVASGVCFHLFTSHRFTHHFREQPIPEIQRAPLEQIVLKIKILDLFKDCDTEDVLHRLLEPPSQENIHFAMKRLQDLGALDEEWGLTPLGYHLAFLPVDVRIGKLMLFGAIFRCLDPALTIAASLSFKSPFVAPFDKRDDATKKKLEFATGNSDHLTVLQAYKGWVRAGKGGNYVSYCYCQENYLSIKTFQMLASMKRQFVELLSDIGFIKRDLSARDIEKAARDGGDGVIESTGFEANSNSENIRLVQAMLCAALYPNIVQVMTPEQRYVETGAGAIPKAPKPEDLKFKTKADGYVNIHPSSVNFQVRYYESPYLVYHEKVKTSRVFLRDCSMVSPYSLVLFGGGTVSIDLDRLQFILSLDEGWIRFQVQSLQVAELIRELRQELDQMLEDKIENPDIDLCLCTKGSMIISAIIKLVTTQ